MLLRRLLTFYYLLTIVLPLCAAKLPVTRPHGDPHTLQSSEGGFWRSDRGFDSYLRIKNVLLKTPLTVIPVIYMADGFEVDLPPVTLEPAGVASINLKVALADAGVATGGHSSSFGMAAIKYRWGWSAVLATIQNIDEVESLTYHSTLGADTRALNAKGSAEMAHLIRGLWWAPHAHAAGYLALANAAKGATSAQLLFYDEHNKELAHKTLVIASHAVALVALDEVLANVKSIDATGSVTIAYEGGAHSLLAYEGIEDRGAGYSASPMLAELSTDVETDTPAISQVILDAPGVMVGAPDPKLLFPAQTVFNPYAYLYNTANVPLRIGVSVIGLQGGISTPISTVLLPPGATHKVDIAAILRQGHITNLSEYVDLVFAFEGRPAYLAVEAGSTDQTRNYVFEVPALIESRHISKTICYWTTSGYNDTMISVHNFGGVVSDNILTLYFAGGHYKYSLRLDAGATKVLSLREIQNGQLPDRDGNVIPTNIPEGSALLESANGETSTMPVSVTSASFNVRNGTCTFNCTTCNGLSEFVLSPQDLFLGVDGQAQLQGMETYNTETVESTTTGTWTSGASSVLSINGSGMASGVSSGQTNANLSIFDVPLYVANTCTYSGEPSCPQASEMGASTPISVNVPVADRITLTISNGPSSCPSGYIGLVRKVGKVNTTVRTTIPAEYDFAVPGQMMTETVTVSPPNAMNLAKPTVGSGNTNAVGGYTDVFGFCSAVCPSNPAATTQLIQVAHDQYGANTYSWTNSLTYTCKGPNTENGQ